MQYNESQLSIVYPWLKCIGSLTFTPKRKNNIYALMSENILFV